MTQPDDVDPEILAARALQAAVVPPFDITKLHPAEGRDLVNQVAMVFNDGKPTLPHVETMFIDGPSGKLRCRLYQPEGAPGRGAVYYIHGGGWFACDVDTHDRMLRSLAAESGFSVFGIDYRLSPEHPFPAGLEDCLAGWHWLRNAAGDFGIDAGHLAIAGDSAGANLALALTLSERDSGRPMPTAAGLLYGCYAPGLKTASRERYGNGLYGLTGPRMDWYWANYLGAAAAAPPILATPLFADLNGLPPCYIGIAECDVLAGDNHLFAERLREAGGTAILDVWRNTTHGILQMTRDVAAARAAVAATARALKNWI